MIYWKKEFTKLFSKKRERKKRWKDEKYLQEFNAHRMRKRWEEKEENLIKWKNKKSEECTHHCEEEKKGEKKNYKLKNIFVWWITQLKKREKNVSRVIK